MEKGMSSTINEKREMNFDSNMSAIEEALTRARAHAEGIFLDMVDPIFPETDLSDWDCRDYVRLLVASMEISLDLWSTIARHLGSEPREIKAGDNEYEIAAVRDTVDAITDGITKIASGVDSDGSLPPDEEAAMRRLQKVLDALNDTYPGQLVDELFDQACGTEHIDTA
jgi:hypothetical protein